MSLTRQEAERIAEEARQQGWEGDKHIVNEGTDQEYNKGRGQVTVHDWDEINRQRRERWGPDGEIAGTGCTVELHFPGILGPKYWIRTTDEWRQLKAKVDELKEILRQAAERGWQIPSFSHPQKVGKFGMMIEVVPPGTVYPVRVGGMRTWRKLLREHGDIIEGREHRKQAVIEGTVRVLEGGS